MKGFKKKKDGLRERDHRGNDNAGFWGVFVGF